ncbi:MAG: ABC transporter ATP-binding protein [Nakamurella sp.]
MSGAGLVLQELVIGYRRVPLLPPISATAQPGRVTVLLGPNGSGKSTLLRTVAALQPALGGSATLDGAPLAAIPPRSRARSLAVVLTDRFDPGLLRGGEVVALGRRPYTGAAGILRADDRAAVERALSALHAESLADVPLAEMSDGQRQRILIARALAQDPALLVLDEPSAFLDAPGRIELLAVLRRIAEDRSIPVLVSTHDVEAALRAGQDGWVIDGRVLRTGTVDALRENVIGPAFATGVVEFDSELGIFRLRRPHSSQPHL